MQRLAVCNFFPSTYFLFTIHTGFEDQIAAFVDAEVARTLATAERQSNIFYYGSLNNCSTLIDDRILAAITRAREILTRSGGSLSPVSSLESDPDTYPSRCLLNRFILLL